MVKIEIELGIFLFFVIMMNFYVLIGEMKRWKEFDKEGNWSIGLPPYPNWSRIEINRIGIFFFRYYDMLLCTDHKYAKIK